jgi:beta-glucosidase
VRELKGFARVAVAAGQSRELRFALGPEQLRYWNAAARDWVLDESSFDVWVGGDSTAGLAAEFTVRGNPDGQERLPRHDDRSQ